MTSKESLKSICLECERYKGKIQVRCPFRSISNDYCEEYETIEKDLERLEEYRKIGEELGIDLITLFKALKDGINVYYEDIGRYKFRNNLRLEYHKTLGWGLVYIFGCGCRDDMPMKLEKEFFELKGYGKTWALTKEELENDN